MRRTYVLWMGLLFLFLSQSSFAEEVYRWVDEKGIVHYSDDESSVPERYRDQIEKRSVREEPNPPKEKSDVGKPGIKSQKEKSSEKKKGKPNVRKIEGDVTDAVKTIISLWRDEKYGVLFGHGDQKSRASISKKEFERRMMGKGWVLASSWETFRDIQVDVKSATLAYATVKIGYKPKKGGETKFHTETYRMSLEDKEWKINLSHILQAKM